MSHAGLHGGYRKGIWGRRVDLENATAADLTMLIPPGSGWTLSPSESINENGDIADFGTFNGQGHRETRQVAWPAAQRRPS